MKQYNKANISLAKQLRKNMTPWERKLWYDYLRYYPIRFQRQKAIGSFIADFYCAKARLVIELDGGGHYTPEQSAADAARTQALENMNLKVLRICNLDVDQNFRGVCEHIDHTVQESLPQSASLTAPSSEGALVRPTHNKIFALGFFDGVHLGHQALLKACRELAEHTGALPGAVTFEGHPDTLIHGRATPLINTVADRHKLLSRYGMECILSIPFDETLMNMPWTDFFRLLVKEHGAAGFVCGDDFRFGYRGEGNAEKLRTACEAEGIPCTVVPGQNVDGIRVSSTHIRNLLEAGRMEEAVRFLGHPHILSGEVISGRRLGRTIGVPTANLKLPADILCPKLGVYACMAVVGSHRYPAVTNIGFRPTVGGHHVTVEPWILNFEGDLYGKILTLEFHSFLRPEKKFDSLEDLKAEIQKNAAQTLEIFEKT